MNSYTSLKSKILGLGVAAVLLAISSGCAPPLLAQTDVNSDGLGDSITCVAVDHGGYKSYDVRVALGRGDGYYFEPQTIFSLRNRPFDFKFGDMNNDGFVDIGFSLEDDLSCHQYLAPGRMDGTFGSPRRTGFCED